MQCCSISNALVYHFLQSDFDLDSAVDSAVHTTTTGMEGVDEIPMEEHDDMELIRRHEMVACVNVAWAPSECVPLVSCGSAGTALAVVSKTLLHIWCSDNSHGTEFRLAGLAPNTSSGYFTHVAWQPCQARALLIVNELSCLYRSRNQQLKWPLRVVENATE